jgi:hypothetical protein
MSHIVSTGGQTRAVTLPTREAPSVMGESSMQLQALRSPEPGPEGAKLLKL